MLRPLEHPRALAGLGAATLLIALGFGMYFPWGASPASRAPTASGSTASGAETAMVSTPVATGAVRAASALYDSGVIILYSDKRAMRVQSPAVMELPNEVKILPTGEVVGSSGYQLGFMGRGDAIVIGSGRDAPLDWRKGSGAALTVASGSAVAASGATVASSSGAALQTPATPARFPGPAGEILMSLYGTGSIPSSSFGASANAAKKNAGALPVSSYVEYSEETLRAALSAGKRVIVVIGTGSCAQCDTLRADMLRGASSIPADAIVFDLRRTDADTLARFAPTRYPTAVLLDAEGKIKKRSEDPRALSDVIANLLLLQ